MITPQDLESLAAMVGQDFAQSPSQEFVAEYSKRLGMVSRAGMTMAGLGVIPLMQLICDMGVSTPKEPERYEVANWREIPVGTKILYDGRRGTFQGISDDGMLFVRLDGYRANHEVNAAQVVLTKPIVEGMADEVFEADSDDPLMGIAHAIMSGSGLPKVKMGEPNEPVQGNPKATDDLFLVWGSVDAGQKVTFDDDGEAREGSFVDLEGDSSIILLVGDERRIVDASLVTPPEPAKV